MHRQTSFNLSVNSFTNTINLPIFWNTTLVCNLTHYLLFNAIILYFILRFKSHAPAVIPCIFHHILMPYSHYSTLVEHIYKHNMHEQHHQCCARTRNTLRTQHPAHAAPCARTAAHPALNHASQERLLPYLLYNYLLLFQM